jgi:myosin-5|uniref:Myosin A n=3 Tax=Phaeodactylum tricornutum TaxID=2850 RepID=C6JVY3_PHATR|nr:myosin A [Phaeodactylum tricornutum]|mmetsp:Transcript_79005/g.211080  ORF Transcript_79005/g.211080 Transcript_79005/m.211080 type:complete len:1111 (-) Transcript_79005:85-3417(-)
MVKKVAKDEKQTTYVYIMDKNHAWRPAILEDTKGDKAIVSVPEYKNEEQMRSDGGRNAKKGQQQTIDLKEYPSKVLPLQNVDHNGNLTAYPDMVRLPYLHEAGILYNLKERHLSGKPYTRTGDIVIAVNPFQWFHDLYTEKKRVYYSNRLVWEAADQDPRDSMEPHVYEVSSLSYKGLAFEMMNQSILVSGESGAGKTETVKICMNHMASVQKGPIRPGMEESLDPVVQRVVESNPLLEAFGNAKTRRNDNSSRFGKYLQLQFDNSKMKESSLTSRSVSNCLLAGSKCDVYLLEKNRVCVHDDWERTYHIFYQLLAAPDDVKGKFWSKLKGTSNKSFKYVGETDTKKIEGQTDAEHFQHTINTLELIGISGDKLKTLVRALCITMQCGNLTFGAKGGDRDKSEITSKTECSDLAELMGVGVNDLNLAFTERTMKTRTDTYKVPLNTEAAKDAADAFAKEVYGKVFLWVVKEINAATCAEDNYKKGSMATFEYGIIGLLDIFGFESFIVNRFEQLCINYANEKLQQKFTEDVFRAVQAEYEAEGIALAEIQYDDNTDVLDLIEGRSGLLAMLNEECVRPKGNDQDFVQKALVSNKSSPCLIVNMMDRMSFGVHHYAGKVMYDADKFVTSNQDTLPTDLEDIGLMSDNDIINKKHDDEAVARAKRGPPKRQRSNIVAPTVWGKYKTQLASLMGNLRKTNSRYIRCIKPNMKKVPNVMEHVPTVEQLRCAGVVAAVTLARSAFPNRLDNSAVRFRYSSTWDKNAYPSIKNNGMAHDEALRCDCDAMMTEALKCKQEIDDKGLVKKAFVVGRTKTYFRAGALEYLESNRQTGFDTQAATIQKYARGFLVRKQFSDLVKGRAEAEREAREAAEREARAARELAESAKEERMMKRQNDKQKYEDQIKSLKKQLDDADEHREKKLLEAEERKEQAQRELEQLREDTSESARKAMMEPKKLAAQQKKKLEEQTKLIEFLKKENKKIRKDHDKIKDKFDVVKSNNDKLIAANENTGENFEELNDDTGKVNNKNEDLLTTLEKAKKQNKTLKEDCMKRQDDYMTQAETRLEYQKTMARILNMIQETSKEPQIVEDTCVIALECEAESKSIMAALEAEVDM